MEKSSVSCKWYWILEQNQVFFLVSSPLLTNQRVDFIKDATLVVYLLAISCYSRKTGLGRPDEKDQRETLIHCVLLAQLLLNINKHTEIVCLIPFGTSKVGNTSIDQQNHIIYYKMIEVKELQVSCLMTHSISTELVKEKYFTYKTFGTQEGGRSE